MEQTSADVRSASSAESSPQPAQSDDWLAGATIEFGGEAGECVQVAIEGVEFGSDENVA